MILSATVSIVPPLVVESYGIIDLSVLPGQPLIEPTLMIRPTACFRMELDDCACRVETR